MEIIGGKWNVLIGIGLEFAWAFGYAILPLIAYYIPQWTWLHLVVSLPTLLFIPLTFLIPESPRWLLSQGRLEEAEEILRGAVRINGGQWPNSVKLEQVHLQHFYLTRKIYFRSFYNFDVYSTMVLLHCSVSTADYRRGLSQLN